MCKLANSYWDLTNNLPKKQISKTSSNGPSFQVCYLLTKNSRVLLFDTRGVILSPCDLKKNLLVRADKNRVILTPYQFDFFKKVLKNILLINVEVDLTSSALS